MTRRLYCLRALILSLVATAIWLAGGDRPVQAYRPESTEVIDLVNKATAYLEHNARSGEPGGQALVALALLKTGRPSSHPSIAKAVISCRQLAARVERDGVGHHCYNVTIACIFLAELDAKTYRAACCQCHGHDQQEIGFRRLFGNAGRIFDFKLTSFLLTLEV